MTKLRDRTKSTTVSTPLVATGVHNGRSGGVVDAPGKKHRTPAADAEAIVAHSQADKMRTAKTMVKTNRRRGRG